MDSIILEQTVKNIIGKKFEFKSLLEKLNKPIDFIENLLESISYDQLKDMNYNKLFILKKTLSSLYENVESYKKIDDIVADLLLVVENLLNQKLSEDDRFEVDKIKSQLDEIKEKVNEELGDEGADDEDEESVEKEPEEGESEVKPDELPKEESIEPTIYDYVLAELEDEIEEPKEAEGEEVEKDETPPTPEDQSDGQEEIMQSIIKDLEEIVQKLENIKGIKRDEFDMGEENKDEDVKPEESDDNIDEL